MLVTIAGVTATWFASIPRLDSYLNVYHRVALFERFFSTANSMPHGPTGKLQTVSLRFCLAISFFHPLIVLVLRDAYAESRLCRWAPSHWQLARRTHRNRAFLCQDDTTEQTERSIGELNDFVVISSFTCSKCSCIVTVMCCIECCWIARPSNNALWYDCLLVSPSTLLCSQPWWPRLSSRRLYSWSNSCLQI